MSFAVTDTQMTDLIDIVERGFERGARMSSDSERTELADAVETAISMLDSGAARVAEKIDGAWQVHQWLKKAVLLSFRINDNEFIKGGFTNYYDKVNSKFADLNTKQFRESGVRVVPPATARFGSYVAPSVVLMPSYVNIGAYVDSGTMVDTWATVGSCAQVGKHVHLSGGVGVGGVLEPVQAAPVIIEDGAFIGSRCILVEGVRIGKEAVLGANVTLTSSSKIIDVTGPEPVEYRGYVPERAVVVPGSFAKQFPAGEYNVNCALIIGQRKASTDLKTSLNDALRENNVSV